MNSPRTIQDNVQRTIDNIEKLHVNIEQNAQTADVQILRAAAILTTSYVNSSSVDIEHWNKGSLLVSFTIGSLTNVLIKVQFSPDDTNWYDEVDANYGGHTIIEHAFAGSMAVAFPLELADKYIRISAKGTGTVTSSSLEVKITGR